MLDFQARVLNERASLSVKLDALRAFFDTNVFKALPVAEHVLLYRQEMAMENYLNILDLRIARF